jgi:hypothetical protein
MDITTYILEKYRSLPPWNIVNIDDLKKKLKLLTVANNDWWILVFMHNSFRFQ